jgi:hypothetical protein
MNLQTLKRKEKRQSPDTATDPADSGDVTNGWHTDTYRSIATASVE